MKTEIRVRGYHTDLFQHVNNARYLEFLEENRWQTFENHMDFKKILSMGYQFFVVNINISYISQARVNDLLIIRCGLADIGNKSAVFEQKVFNKTTDKICATALVTFVITDSKGTPLKIEDELKEFVSKIPPIKE